MFMALAAGATIPSVNGIITGCSGVLIGVTRADRTVSDILRSSETMLGSM